MSIIPSGPPKKRGSSGSVYRPASRRGMASGRLFRAQTPKPVYNTPQELAVTVREIAEDPLRVDFPFKSPKADLYNSLLDLDKKLSQEIEEERNKMQRLFSMPAESLKGILRIHVYNTVTRSTINDTPTWNLRLQGRLVYPDFKEIYGKQSIPPGYLRKFSSFFKKVVFEFPDGEKKEWNKSQMPRETDGIEIKKTSNDEINVKVFLYLDNYPVRYKLSAELSNFLGTVEESQENILQSLWEYIKKYQLQDSEETRYINNNAALIRLFGEERTDISSILAKIRGHLSEADPIELSHQIILSGLWTDTEHLYDIEVDLEDPLQFEMACFMKENNSTIFAENSFTILIPMLKASKGMEIPVNPLEEDIKGLNKELLDTKRSLQLHLDRHKAVSAFLKEPSAYLSETSREQEELLKTLSQASFYDKINKESELDIKSSVFYQEEWVQKVLDKDA